MQNLQYCVQYNTNLSKQESQKLTEDLYRIDIESAYVEAENRYEMAEYLDVTEDYLEEALACYRSKYGVYTVVDNYAIYFIPNIAVARRF